MGIDDNSPAELMEALTAKLYNTMTSNDDTVKFPRDKFVTWFKPGLPFSPDEFLFCQQGMVGSTAEEEKELQHQAFVISKLFDFIPDINSALVDSKSQQTIFTTSQDTVSSVYEFILMFSKVTDMDITPAQQEKLQKFRDLMWVYTEEENLLGDKVFTIKPSAVQNAYNTFMFEYFKVANEYMGLLLDAQCAEGSDPDSRRRVLEWSNRAKLMRQEVDAAEGAWISGGYRDEIMQMNAYIDQVNQKSMVLYKKDLQDKLERCSFTSTYEGDAGDFYYTTLLPGNFATNPSWNNFSFNENDYASHISNTGYNWQGGAAGGVIILGIPLVFGVRASGSHEEDTFTQTVTNFKCSFQYIQVPICRPFMDPEILSMRSWTFDKALQYIVSDGKDNPTGHMVAYPVSALFVRNVVLEFNETSIVDTIIRDHLNVNGTVWVGPFLIGGSYSKSTETYDYEYKYSGGALKIDGMQLIGYINSLVPKCPDLLPSIDEKKLV